MKLLQLHWRARMARIALALTSLLIAGAVSAAPPAPKPPSDDEAFAPGASGPAIAANAPDNGVAGGLAFRYLNISGGVFQGRNDGVGFSTAGRGCMHATAGNARLTVKALLPDGALVKYVRIFYRDTSSTDMNVWLTAYDGAGGFEDIVRVASTGNAGYGTALSEEMNYRVDHYASALALVAGPTVPDDTQEVCGVRLAYYTSEQLDTIFKNGFD
jgi:hypothetical protein